MTLYTILKLAQRFNINMMNELISITKEASSVQGTSAELKEKDILSVWDLLHALMLPSGNDAAHALAEYFGELLIRNTKQNTCTLFFSNNIQSFIQTKNNKVFNASKPRER